MGIDNIDELKPPPRDLHNPATCGGRGICLTCSVNLQAYQEKNQE